MRSINKFFFIGQVFACFGCLLLIPLTSPSIALIAGSVILYYYFHMIGNHVGIHKYWTHKSFEAGPIAECFMLGASWIGMQGHPALWGSGHMLHHEPDKVDTDSDPIYRARKSGNPFKAIWHNYTGHYFKDGLDKSFTRSILKNPRARFTFKYAPFNMLYPLILACISIEALVYLWAIPGAASIFVCGMGIIHGHNGKSGYETFRLDDSRNLRGILWKLIYCGGELENNHHKFPDRCDFAVQPGELDLGHTIAVRFLAKKGSVKD